jgi:hypothetical protein
VVAAPPAVAASPTWVDRFAGSVFSADQSITPDTVFPGVQQSAVPSYQWWLSLRPRFALTPYLSLRARADVTFEVLNGAETTYAHQAQWGDVWTEAVFTGIPRLLGIEATVGVRALWPTSLASQLQNRVVTLGAMAGLSRTFVAGRLGTFNLGLSFTGSHPFVTQTTSSVRGAGYACTSTDFTPTTCSQTDGAMSSVFQLVAAVSGKYSPRPWLSLSASYVVIDDWAYGVPPATLVDATGGVTIVPGSSDDQRLRQRGWFLASVDVDVRRWVSLSVGYSVYRPILDPSSKVGNPFWSPGNSRVFFTTTFGLDEVARAIIDRSP